MKNYVHRLSVGLTDSEYQKLKKLSHVLGYHKSDILRAGLRDPNGRLTSRHNHNRVIKHEFTPKDLKLISKLNDTRLQLARTGNLINQIMRKVNNSGVVLSASDRMNLADLKTETDGIKNAIEEVLGNG